MLSIVWYKFEAKVLWLELNFMFRLWAQGLVKILKLKLIPKLIVDVVVGGGDDDVDYNGFGDKDYGGCGDGDDDNDFGDGDDDVDDNGYRD